jgi:glycosyltransferase A (GT-A) superfamily protein (DUF2064 family)
VLAARGGPLVVIGTDIPLLAPSHLLTAFDQLHSGCDAVFGPALDGGYYLVGLTQARPVLFDLHPTSWGGPTVLDDSMARARATNLSVGLLDPLRDLDTPEDAEALLRDPRLPAEVRQLLASRRDPVAFGAGA